MSRASVLALLAVLLLSSCSDGTVRPPVADNPDHNPGTPDPVPGTGDPDPNPNPDPAPDELPRISEVQALLADHLAEVQNDDGSFGWQRDIAQPWDTSGEGFQNVTGPAAMGIFALWDADPRLGWGEVLNGVQGYLEGRLNILLADPATLDNNVSCSNWVFLVEYLERFPSAPLQNKTVNAVNALLDARDSAYGNNAATRVDGLYRLLLQRRRSIPGIIPWDWASCAGALEAMQQLDPAFADDADDAYALLAEHLNNTFLPAHDASPARAYNDISLALPLHVLNVSSRSAAYEALRDALEARLLPLIDVTGRVTNQPGGGEPVQSSAYALAALKSTGSELAAVVQSYLESRVRPDGIIEFPQPGIETFLVEGEVLLSLILPLSDARFLIQ